MSYGRFEIAEMLRDAYRENQVDLSDEDLLISFFAHTVAVNLGYEHSYSSWDGKSAFVFEDEEEE